MFTFLRKATNIYISRKVFYRASGLFVAIKSMKNLDGMAIKEPDVAVDNNLKTLGTSSIPLELLVLNHPITSLVRKHLPGREFDRHFEI